MQTEESRKLVLDYLAAQGSGDREKMMALLNPDAEFFVPVSVGLIPPKGAAGLVKFMMEEGPKFFDMSTLRVDILKIVADGDTVVIRLRTEVKALNGRDYSNELVYVYTCENEKIVEHMDSLRFKEIVLDG